MTLAFFGLPNGIELVMFLAIVLLLFGNRLPDVMRSLGRSIVEFKKGQNDGDKPDSSGGSDRH